MLVTFLDDSYTFDGSTKDNHPLGGSEKSLILLAESLATIGHIVRVFNNCEHRTVINNVSWNPIKNMKATHSDVWIVHNNPLLFNQIDNNTKKILWLTKSGLKLVQPQYFSITMKHRPTLVYQGENHLDSIPDAVKSLDAAMIPPAIPDYYLNQAELVPSVTPIALVTSHPLMGLEWLLDVWHKKIHTKLPWAELHVFSNILSKFIEGKNISERYNAIIKKIEDKEKFNIRIKKPLIDKDMVSKIKNMRVHLYPSHDSEVSAFTLSESQALGLPAVVRNKGVAPYRIINGKTGFVSNDDQSFADFSIRFLEDRSAFERASVEAKKNNTRTVKKLAIEFIKVISGIHLNEK